MNTKQSTTCILYHSRPLSLQIPTYINKQTPTSPRTLDPTSPASFFSRGKQNPHPSSYSSSLPLIPIINNNNDNKVIIIIMDSPQRCQDQGYPHQRQSQSHNTPRSSRRSSLTPGLSIFSFLPSFFVSYFSLPDSSILLFSSLFFSPIPSLDRSLWEENSNPIPSSPIQATP